MKFDKAIEGLYSDDLHIVCETLNTGCHLNSISDSDISVVDTGFECKLHTGTIFRIVYWISEEKLVYFKKNNIGRSIMGLPFRINREIFPGFRFCFISDESQRTIQFFDSYDVRDESFHSIAVLNKKVEDDLLPLTLSFRVDNDEHTRVSFFYIIDKSGERIPYPLLEFCIPVFYKDGNGFHEYKTNLKHRQFDNRGADDVEESLNSWDNYGNSCEKYNGYNGWSDDQIDDIFGGIPEATWNLD